MTYQITFEYADGKKFGGLIADDLKECYEMIELVILPDILLNRPPEKEITKIIIEREITSDDEN